MQTILCRVTLVRSRGHVAQIAGVDTRHVSRVTRGGCEEAGDSGNPEQCWVLCGHTWVFILGAAY